VEAGQERAGAKLERVGLVPERGDARVKRVQHVLGVDDAREDVRALTAGV
jgi:hypothetical protein